MAGNKPKKINIRRVARFDLYHIMNFYPVPITRKQATKIMKVSDSTMRRYLAGTANPHPAAVELLKLYASGRIMPESFKSCYFHRDALIDDYGQAHRLGDLRVHQVYKKSFYEYLSIQRTHDIKPKPREIVGETLKKNPPKRVNTFGDSED